MRSVQQHQANPGDGPDQRIIGKNQMRRKKSVGQPVKGLATKNWSTGPDTE
ncbi:MAG: hypothetical protein WC256_12340 [Desulfurivibrionaceae bacterium]